ncbi:MAG: TetR/AcrR family transcriptional regulator [Chloroflexota bacterium]
MTTKRKTDRRIGRTRKLLQNALIELLKEKPLAKIQIKEIAEVANVSRPAFYKHFETKERLLFSLVDDVFNQIHETVFDNVTGNDPVEMHQILTKFYQQWQLHREEVQWVMQVENKDLLISSLRTNVTSIKQRFDEHFPPLDLAQDFEDYLLDFAAGGAYMLLKRWIESDFRETPETMATLSFLLLYNGFSPARAQGLFDDISL